MILPQNWGEMTQYEQMEWIDGHRPVDLAYETEMTARARAEDHRRHRLLLADPSQGAEQYRTQVAELLETVASLQSSLDEAHDFINLWGLWDQFGGWLIDNSESSLKQNGDDEAEAT